MSDLHALSLAALKQQSGSGPSDQTEQCGVKFNRMLQCVLPIGHKGRHEPTALHRGVPLPAEPRQPSDNAIEAAFLVLYGPKGGKPTGEMDGPELALVERALEAAYAVDSSSPLSQPQQQLTIDVVAAVRRNAKGEFWIVRRTSEGRHGGLAGMYEFPGGKVESGETLTEALQREMMEEFGAPVLVGALLDTIVSESEGKAYRVHFMETDFLDSARLSVHDHDIWVPADQLHQFKHLPSGTEFCRRQAASPLSSTPKKEGEG